MNSKRKFVEKYPDSSRRIAKDKPSAPPQKFKSVGDITAGTCFLRRVRQKDDDARTCCESGCNLKFSTEEIVKLRGDVPSRGIGTQESRKVWVRNCLAEGKQLRLDGSSGNRKVCTAFFCAVTGCSRTLIASASQPGGTGMKKRHLPNSKADSIAAFLRELASRWEMEPDSCEILVALPSKRHVWMMYIQSPTCIHLGHEDCSYAYFVQMWSLQCPHVKLKSSMGSAKCNTCTLANAELDHLRIHGGPEWRTSEAGLIERLLRDHEQDIADSRGFYMDQRQKAIATPHKLLCIAIDGSGQSSYACPTFPQETKDSSRDWKLRFKLIGTLVAGRSCHFFTLANNWETGANLTIQVLHSTLVSLFKKSLETGEPLPRELHLQCDNYSRENKSRIVCAYLTMLIRWGLFDKVELHFGLDGHTHDEIDQVFSRAGVALKKQPAVTRTCLGEIIVNSYKRNVSSFPVEIEHLYNLANIRGLLVGHTFPIPYITKPQAFLFSTDPTDSKIKMQVQHRSYGNQWARIDAHGKYSPGYMEVISSWPKLRDTPDHPRRATDSSTIAQHLMCLKACDSRIREALQHSPQGISYDQAVVENNDSIRLLEKDEPMRFAWDLTLGMYDLSGDDEDLNGRSPPHGGKGGERSVGEGGGKKTGGGDGEAGNGGK